MAPVGSCQQLSPCLTEPTPSRSKMDTLLAKAKSMDNGGNTTVITHLKKEEEKKQSGESEHM